LGKRVVGVELLMWVVVDGQVGRGEVLQGLSLRRICRWRNRMVDPVGPEIKNEMGGGGYLWSSVVDTLYFKIVVIDIRAVDW